MLRDADDPCGMHLFAQALASPPNIQANAIIAGEDGIHWQVIHESAALVHYVTEHSPHSQGNFNAHARQFRRLGHRIDQATDDPCQGRRNDRPDDSGIDRLDLHGSGPDACSAR